MEIPCARIKAEGDTMFIAGPSDGLPHKKWLQDLETKTWLLGSAQGVFEGLHTWLSANARVHSVIGTTSRSAAGKPFLTYCIGVRISREELTEIGATLMDKVGTFVAVCLRNAIQRSVVKTKHFWRPKGKKLYWRRLPAVEMENDVDKEYITIKASTRLVLA